MPFKRPAPYPQSRSGSHAPSDDSPAQTSSAKRARASHSAKALSNIKLYIVAAKLDPPVLSDLIVLAEHHAGSLCKHAVDADVIITAIGMRRRLERHIPWDLARTKAVVTPNWLRDSIEYGAPLPCGEYVAIQDLRTETEAHCPDCNISPCACSDSEISSLALSSRGLSPLSNTTSRMQSPSLHTPQPPHAPPMPPQSASSSSCAAAITTIHRYFPHDSGTKLVSTLTGSPLSEVKVSTRHIEIPAHLLPPSPPIPTNIAKLNYASRYACQRASPLECPNPGLVKELDVLRRSRALEGEERSALSYARAISIVKAYPRKIRSLQQVEKLPFIGAKIGGMVEEYVLSGKITEAQSILASERFQALSLFATIYGIGPTTARKLYALGLRSLDNLEVYYGVERDQGPSEEIIEVEKQTTSEQSYRNDKDKGRRRGVGGWGGEKGEGDEGLGESWVRIALELREDLSIKIPRAEVEEMNRVVMAELDELEPGCVSTIAGGYRRGKPESNDVDIVFTHPDGTRIKGLCKRLVRRLHERKMVTHVMHLSGFHGHNPLRTNHWDSLEKSLTVFILPSTSHSKGLRRRLDLIFAPPEIYWTAVIGWSGSIMFERDLRQWAKDKVAMKFDSSGITRRYDSKQFFPKTEKEAFNLLGLEWIDPTLRNADA
ncbi:uncharacterized protein FIBRA_05056 [Fibroporia radiculosa]|uniref:DNA-directed DNA polymerase n=1 Tax=Fibroporia radiculosa TaxID=599839 RepID=J4IAH9_9APHY|nr:uncharacterized protein FIBRA_05056 [Fibroporia radiculosa]CCM02941.1 predicted protein [Fibroporia radiculosa]